MMIMIMMIIMEGYDDADAYDNVDDDDSKNIVHISVKHCSFINPRSFSADRTGLLAFHKQDLCFHCASNILFRYSKTDSCLH